MRDRISLRARLLVVALALVAAGLVASGLATHHYLNRFLLERVDEDLATARIPATSVVRDAQDDGPAAGGGGRRVTSCPSGRSSRSATGPARR
jgi:hypothetical protein